MNLKSLSIQASGCFHQKKSRKVTKPSEIIVAAGKYDLSKITLKAELNVTEILIHSDWIYNIDEESYEADIAVLVLDQHNYFFFTKNIWFACVPNNRSIDAYKSGFIVSEAYQ